MGPGIPRKMSSNNHCLTPVPAKSQNFPTSFPGKKLEGYYGAQLKNGIFMLCLEKAILGGERAGCN